MPVTIDAIVPVYGGWEHVEPCLRALASQTRPVNVLVVDDCGPDDTADRIATDPTEPGDRGPAADLARAQSLADALAEYRAACEALTAWSAA